ncbi:MAG: anhydro-N-acetylmuramic acid kinase [Lentimicrobiaceae bacterium]|nr:anhydro-N-acetylmuramic acid kinase [Lentimicrobiaceae bacterium]
MRDFKVIGLMSGSSLDGVDIAYVNFSHDNKRWFFQIVEAGNVPYSSYWKEQLAEAFNKKPEDLKELDKEYGRYLGTITKRFIEKYELEPKLIASHGHTIFHRPDEGFTLQIGDGQEIAKATGITTVNDFRSEDVMKGGQGAPLVPIGDRHLFADYPICLNIGGIANVSYEYEGKRIAYDICIANQMLNYLANKLGYDYDNNGSFARQGKVNLDLLKAFNDNSYYDKEAPKSLGREFFEKYQHQIIEESSLDVRDILATATEHIASQIVKSTDMLEKSKMLITGGGAKNNYLVERISELSKHEVVIPDTMIIDYKEALIFAFLGTLKMEGKINVLSSVTGATSDSSSGTIHN